MTTPAEHVEKIKEIAEIISDHPDVLSAFVDDWGRFSNFTLIITPNKWTRGSTNKLKSIVNKALLNTPAHLRDVFPPEFTGYDYSRKRTYNCHFWKFDVDYHEYNPYNNVFNTETGKVLSD